MTNQTGRPIAAQQDPGSAIEASDGGLALGDKPMRALLIKTASVDGKDVHWFHERSARYARVARPD